VFGHRQVQHRGLRMDLEHPDYGGVPTLGPAARYSGFNVTEGWTAPPLLGQHSGEILRDWLDMPEEDIARLQETRIT
jgi:succinate---hydroxymethylglutarate CoA-transferase